MSNLYLFERLSLTEKDGLTNVKDAVIAQIEKIVTTSSRNVREASDSTKTILDFGLPCIPELGMNNRQQLELHVDEVKKAISHYEPRIKCLSVEVVPGEKRLMPFQIMITGYIESQGNREELRFPIAIPAG